MNTQATLWNFDKPLSPYDVLLAMPREGRVTRRMIAREMRRAKSPTLVNAINAMCERGWLSTELVTLPNGVGMYTYELTDLGRWERSQELSDGPLG